MSCRQVRRELLEHFAIHEELGPRSGPHLAHLESCADCREEVGIDRELVRQLRSALQQRVAVSAPPEASWELVRSRTVDRPAPTWTARLVHWGGMASAAAAAGIMMFAVVTAPNTGLFPRAQSPFVASAVRRAVPPVEEASRWPPAYSSTELPPPGDPPLPGWPKQTQRSDYVAVSDGDPPITGRMR